MAAMDQDQRRRRSPVPDDLSCPHCKSRDVARRRQRWWQRVVAIFGVRAYRCKYCGRAFMAR
jgi:DNA-directed RNA polymerase subunit RPC12/RpoP